MVNADASVQIAHTAGASGLPTGDLSARDGDKPRGPTLLVDGREVSLITERTKKTQRPATGPTAERNQVTEGDQVGDILAFALKAALDGGPALMTVLKVGMTGARENMLASPAAVKAYLAVCDSTLRLISSPSTKEIAEFMRLLKDLDSCASGIARASRHAPIKEAWRGVVQEVETLRQHWMTATSSEIRGISSPEQ
jgi:hypothetical protein